MVIHVKALSLDMAKKAAAAAEKKASEKNITIAIAIMDNHGNLKFFSRMDSNSFISVRMAPLKAMTSASIPLSTKALAERNKTLDNGPYSAVQGIVLLEGGLPIITKDGQHIGAIGISGATPELDGICAQAALDTLVDDL
jgi:glc operon protein GlcG